MTPGGSTPASATELPRQWRAIVFADLVESVRLMQDHGFTLVERWRGYVAQVREQLLLLEGTRLVRTAGDGLLIECGDEARALRLALDLHRWLDADARQPRLQLRIGIHCAEVLLDEQEAYGPGVNLAARVAASAQPGQTLLTLEARRHLQDGLQACIDDLGLRFLKHFSEPIRVFAASPLQPSSARRPARAAPQQDLRPVLAVLPFTVMPEGPQRAALGHALADDLIATLARHTQLRILAGASTAQLRTAELAGLGPQRIEQVLGASYLLAGRIYERGGGLRVHAELASLPDGVVRWADQADSSVEALFSGQDALVPSMASRVGEVVQAQELKRVRQLPMHSLASYSLYLGACGLMNSLLRQDFERARELLDHLTERHPRQAAPHALLARWHVLRTVQGWSDNREHDGIAASSLAQRAIDMDPDQAVAHTALAVAKLNLDDDVDGARQHNALAIAADPLEALAFAQQAGVLCFCGEVEAADAAVQQALAISPLDPNRFLFEAFAAMVALAGDQPVQAVQWAQQSVRRHGFHLPSHRLLVAALWLAGQADAATAAAARLLQLQGADRAAGVRRKTPPASWRQRYEDALRDALARAH